jgi:hypothetical protein
MSFTTLLMILSLDKIKIKGLLILSNKEGKIKANHGQILPISNRLDRIMIHRNPAQLVGPFVE